ncbi:MAG TPA: hypothetical protein VJ276_23795 [Thermoanaerobaculia bacterium]|nr:hypothetical protein [Thermoanaerobaculia bacterium]
MAEMILNLTIVPVGPRDSFVRNAGEKWRFALQLAVSFTEQPTEQEIEKFAKAMLPWIALRRPHDTIKVAWNLIKNGRVLRDAGTFDINVDAKTEGTLSLPIRDDLEFGEVWRDYAKIPQPERKFGFTTQGEAKETTKTTILLPSVLQSLGGATPEISSAQLQCTWYFDVNVTAGFVNALAEGDVQIAAWPMLFIDDRTHTQFEYIPNIDIPHPFVFEGKVLRIPYRRTDTGAASRPGRTLPFPLKTEPDEPVLKTYWLPAKDSRLDSLAEIEAVVAQALSLRARIASLTPDLIFDAGIKRANTADAAADARAFLDLARKVFEQDPELDRDLVRKMIGDALKQADFLGELRKQIVTAATTSWTTVMMAKVNAAARAAGIAEWIAGTPSFDEFAEFLLPKTTDIKPLLPGEGIDVLLGAADTRLRHLDAEDTANDSDHAQIAELGVLVRRAKSDALLAQRDWSLATATVAVLANFDGDDRYWGSRQPETARHSDRPIVRGIRSAFINGLSSTDITYRGVPLVAETVGSALHGNMGRETEESDAPEIQPLMPLSFQTVGPVKDEFPNISSFCLVPPLRYGDWYQFAGFVIDRGGGIPRELVPADTRPVSSNFDWQKLTAGTLTALDTSEAIHFLRRVPVGEVNIRPMPNTSAPAKPPSWPALPEGVTLRSREWLSVRAPKSDSVPALLMSKGDDYTLKNPEIEFRVSAPALDEHTLSRWMMPAALAAGDDPQPARVALAKLNDALADIHAKRDALPEKPDWRQEANVLPFDPAVAKIGLRCTFVDETGRATERETSLDVAVTVSAKVGAANEVAGERITLRPGSFVAIELVPLVAKSDFDARFEALAMRNLIEEDVWIDEGGAEFRAFHPSRILIEAASAELPEESKLFQALTVTALPNGAIDVSLSPADGVALSSMAFADRFELTRQRWVWRNRPIFTIDEHDMPRPLQSELPDKLATAERDDHIDVLRFDALAELDRGLVDRGRIGGRVPREADSTPLVAPRFLIDDRDAVSHADYLRFGCTLISRYEGILIPRKRHVVARMKHADDAANVLEPVSQRTWKRVTTPFRGDPTRLKAPKVLAILPLTQRLQKFAIPETSPDATPFLIVLDEIWFREYGPGERLNVEVVLETREIGEPPKGKEGERPFRVGPLPDHYVQAQRLYDPSSDDKQDAGVGRHLFKVFGPFGHSLDRSGNEALANATAFIAFAPAEVKTHYAAFVRMRRVVGGIEGPPGATYALYTQPDARQLLAGGDAELIVKSVKNELHYEGLALDLRPTEQTDASVSDQYRYLLIAGPNLHDFGRGSNLFLPKQAAWLTPHERSVATSDGSKLEAGTYSARILELLLNGRLAKGKSPIEKTMKLKELLASLFVNDANPEDAPAMIRRISPSFTVRVEG